MKVLIGVDVGSYTFDKIAKTVTLIGLSPIDLESVLLITNVTDNTVIYQFDTATLGGSIAGNVITLTYDTTAMSNTDALQIFINYNYHLPNTSAFGVRINGIIRTTQTSLGAYNFCKDLLPNLFHFVGTGSVTYSNQAARLSVTSGQYIIGQSNIKHQYYAGNPQLLEFTLDSAQTLSNCSVEWGFGTDSIIAPYSGSYDGFRFRIDNGVAYIETLKIGIVKLSKVRSEWDNPLTGYTFDNFTVTAIDYLYLGGAGARYFVRVGGEFVLVHTFNYAGTAQGTFISNPNLPVRFALRSTTGTATVNFFCSRVASDGGLNDDIGVERSYDNGSIGLTAATIGTNYAILAVRLKTLNLDNVVRLIKCIPYVNSQDSAKFSIILNPTIAGVVTYTGVTNEPYEIAVGIATNIVTGGMELAKEYSGQSQTLSLNYKSIFNQLTARLDGTRDILVFAVTPLSQNITTLGSITLKTF